MTQYILKGLDRHSEYVTTYCISQDLPTIQAVKECMQKYKEDEDTVFIIDTIEEIPANGHYCPLHVNREGVCLICGRIV